MAATSLSQLIRSASRMGRTQARTLAKVSQAMQKVAKVLPSSLSVPTGARAPRPSAAATRPATAGNPTAGSAFRMPTGMPAGLFTGERVSPARPDAPVKNAPCPATHSGSDVFVSGSFAHGGRHCDYKLYLPPGAARQGARAGMPLVVMLHGCTQNPDDFATGTAMNALARERDCYVLYPAQAQDANPNRCWNWFKHNHQQRGSGEPALIAALTQRITATQAVDPERVYVAGLSAGGAMATIVAQAYPDVFAAAGVHSGLARGTARDAMSALQAMRTGDGPPADPYGMAGGRPDDGPAVPTIIFHGDADATVHPRHGNHVLREAMRGKAQPTGTTQGSPVPGWTTQAGSGASEGGQRYTRQVHSDTQGTVRAESWELHGAGHAWSGGDRRGSYTDPRGADASREMLRFFFAHGQRRVG